MEQKEGYNANPEREKFKGGRFNIDYGFVRGNAVTKNDDGKFITGIDGYNC